MASSALMTPMFRVSFPEIWEKRAFREGQAGRYSVTALFKPSEFSDKDKARWQAILAACNKLSLEKWKKSYKDAQAAGAYTLPFKKGETKEYAGYGPGIIFCTLAASLRRPGVVDKNGVPITRDGGGEEFYAGCFARATINPYIPKGWPKTMALGLNNLQKLKDGERLDAFSSAEDDFGNDASEYGDDDFGGDEQVVEEAFDPAA